MLGLRAFKSRPLLHVFNFNFFFICQDLVKMKPQVEATEATAEAVPLRCRGLKFE